MEKMYSRDIKVGLTFGEAMHEAIHNNQCVAREEWGGFWFNHVPEDEMELFTEPVLVAVLKDGKSMVPATPYNADIQAMDWKVVDGVTFPEI